RERRPPGLEEGADGLALEVVGEKRRIAQSDLTEARKRLVGDARAVLHVDDDARDVGDEIGGDLCEARMRVVDDETDERGLQEPQDAGDEREMLGESRVRSQERIVDRLQQDVAEKAGVERGERRE